MYNKVHELRFENIIIEQTSSRLPWVITTNICQELYTLGKYDLSQAKLKINSSVIIEFTM